MLNIVFDPGKKPWEQRVADFWHLSSNGEASDVLFEDDEDRIYAVNHMAYLCHEVGLDVLDYCFMSTHFHIAVHGTRERTDKFLSKFVNILLSHFGKRGYAKYLVFDLIVSVNPMNTVGYVRNAITYIRRNPIMSTWTSLPCDFKGGSGPIFFRSSSVELPHGTKISSMNQRQARLLLHSHSDFPAEWEVTSEGQISPCSFVNILMVEQLFGSVRTYLQCMGRKDDVPELESDAYRKDGLNIRQLRAAGEYYAARLYDMELKAMDHSSRVKLGGIMIEKFGYPKSEGLSAALFLGRNELKNL